MRQTVEKAVESRSDRPSTYASRVIAMGGGESPQYTSRYVLRDRDHHLSRHESA